MAPLHRDRYLRFKYMFKAGLVLVWEPVLEPKAPQHH